MTTTATQTRATQATRPVPARYAHFDSVTMPGSLLIAGADAWRAREADKAANVQPSKYADGCYESESLSRWQERNGSRWLGAQLCRSMYGWSVRFASGLQNFGIIAGCRSGSLDGSFEAAAEYAVTWVAQDPTRRYVFSAIPTEDGQEF